MTIDNTSDNETVEEEVETAAVAEEAETEDVQELLTIDDLLGITSDDDELFTDDGSNHTGMRPLHELLKHLPEDARKHLANMRSNYTQKTQSLADERRMIEKLREELIDTKQSSMNTHLLDEASKHITDEEHDVYSEQGMQAEIKRQAALMLKEMMAPAQEKLALEKNQYVVDAFKAKHPEIGTDEYRIPMAEMLMSRPELSLEDAYYLTAAKLNNGKAKAEMEENKNRKVQRRQAITKTSTGSSSQPKGAPKFKDAWSAYKWHRDNQ